MCSLSKFSNLSSKRNAYSRLEMEETFYSKEHIEILCISVPAENV